MAANAVGAGERDQRRQAAKEIVRLENQVGMARGMRPGTAQPVDDLPIRPPREALLGEWGAQTIAHQPFQRLPVKGRNTLRRMQ